MLWVDLGCARKRELWYICDVNMGVDQSVVVGVVCRSFPFLVICCTVNNENEICVCLRSAYTVSSVHCQCVPLVTITLSVFMFKHALLCHTLHPSHSNICSFNEATDALTNTPPSTCRCFWGNQEAEAGSILFQKLLGPVLEEGGTVVTWQSHDFGWM